MSDVEIRIATAPEGFADPDATVDAVRERIIAALSNNDVVAEIILRTGVTDASTRRVLAVVQRLIENMPLPYVPDTREVLEVVDHG